MVKELITTKMNNSIFIILLAVLNFGYCMKQNYVYKASIKDDSCTLKFQDCGSKAGTITSAVINGTCDGEIAQLKKGTSIQINFTFSSFKDEDTLTSEVYGKIGVLPFIKFNLDNPNACDSSGLTCPIKAGVQENYSAILRILPSYPSVNVIVKWELQNKNSEDVFCIVLPATIS